MAVERATARRCYVLRARRPASVILSRRKLSVRPPAFTVSGFATANPTRTILASGLTVTPCARNVASVHPCGAPASSWSARFSAASRQTFRGFAAIAPARLSRGGCCSRQFGGASAPMMPQRVRTAQGCPRTKCEPRDCN
jgi:hypothetical protein